MGTESFSGVKSGRCVTLIPHPLLVLWSRKSRAIPLLPLWAVRPVQDLSACTVELYLFSPYGPYGLYRASVPVQYSYTSSPPMGRTACTGPQCLYKGALYLSLMLISMLNALYRYIQHYFPQHFYSATCGSFLQFPNFVFSCYIAHVFSE